MNQKIIIAICLLSIIVTIFFTSYIKNDNNVFSIDQFIEEMESRNYTVNLQDGEKDFLPTTRKIITIKNEQIDVYLFRSNKAMEKAASKIQKDGSGLTYKGLFKLLSVEVSWASDPHFYKRGNIIVQYIGTNEQIIKELEEILGPQFAGLK